MKHDVKKYLSVCENDIENICKFLYSHPEESYKEEKSSEFICEVLNKHGFKVEKNILDIKNSFYAYKGNGHPKICFLCEYDSIPNEGHITGHNMLSAISTLSGLCLGNAVDNLDYGSSIIIGCPGEYLGGTKGVMAKQGVFDDIDSVMVIHPDVVTCESGTSSAVIPLSIKFTGKNELSFLSESKYTALDAILLTFNILNTLSKGFCNDLEIHSILSEGGKTPLLVPGTVEGKFYIRAKDMCLASKGEEKIKIIAKTVGDLMNMPPKFSLYEPPNEELLSNSTLNRLLNNNLKESGIINICESRNINASLGIGCISKKVPCIHSYIKIIEDDNIKYGTKEFAKATVEPFALEQCKKAGISLALTGLDLITNKELLSEAKQEFFKNISK